MNEQTSKLIEQLAQKMGTTTEYLWGILIRQAPIDATITLFQIVLVIIGCFVLYKIHKKLISNMPESEHSYYYEYEEAAAIPMIISLIALLIMVIVCICCISDVINGYFNPEYWALDRIIRGIKN